MWEVLAYGERPWNMTNRDVSARTWLGRGAGPGARGREGEGARGRGGEGAAPAQHRVPLRVISSVEEGGHCPHPWAALTRCTSSCLTAGTKTPSGLASQIVSGVLDLLIHTALREGHGHRAQVPGTTSVPPKPGCPPLLALDKAPASGLGQLHLDPGPDPAWASDPLFTLFLPSLGKPLAAAEPDGGGCQCPWQGAYPGPPARVSAPAFARSCFDPPRGRGRQRGPLPWETG